jgi:deoxyribodipyrimidine photo-lyase
VVFWFRHDLRLHDNPALALALRRARERHTWLLPVVVWDPAQTTALTPWGFARQGPHRSQFVNEGVAALADSVQALGTPLWVRHANPVATLTECLQQLRVSELVCEDITAPEEQAAVAALTTAGARLGARVSTVWQSTLFAPEALPMRPEQVPDTFTAFRHKLEASGATEALPLPAVTEWPRVPQGLAPAHPLNTPQSAPSTVAGHGGEPAALSHLARYCTQGLPHTYKATRNALTGFDQMSCASPSL